MNSYRKNIIRGILTFFHFFYRSLTFLISLFIFFWSSFSHSTSICSRYLSEGERIHQVSDILLSKFFSGEQIVRTFRKDDPIGKIQIAIDLSEKTGKLLNLNASEQNILVDALLHDPDFSVRFYVASVLGRLQSPTKDTYNALLRTLENDPDRHIRLSSAKALEKKKL